MRYRCLVLSSALAAVVALASVPVAGQAPRAAGSTAASTNSWTQPRTAWGDPDLQGIWRGLTRIYFERLKEFSDKEFLTEAELAGAQQAAEKRRVSLLRGEAEQRGFRDFPLYNSFLGASEDRQRVSRRTSAITDPPGGKLPPWTSETVKRYEVIEAAQRGRGETDSWEDRAPEERCIHVLQSPTVGNWGMSYAGRDSAYAENVRPDIVLTGVDGPRTASAGAARRILQAPGYVSIVQEEEGGGLFMVPLDGRPRLGPKIRQWGGDSRGHWEGKTLVNEITNIKYDVPFFPAYGFRSLYPGSGETLKVTERYTRVDQDTLEYRYTIEDPKVYTRPYTVLLELTRDDGYAVSPLLCHENNGRNMGGQLSQARADEASALKYAEDSARVRQQRLEEIKAELAGSNKSR